jgi:hypothetical protein
MKNFILLLVVGAIFLNPSCKNENQLLGLVDTVEWKANIVKMNYDPKTPRLNYIPEDLELPNEYQNKTQVFIDSTICMSWSKAGFVSGNKAIKFYKNLQLHIKYEEKEQIANLIQFPLRDKTTKKEFLANYYKIFTPEFKQELLEQKPFELYRNNNGCMAGNDGQLWFKPKGNSFIIFELNYY